MHYKLLIPVSTHISNTKVKKQFVSCFIYYNQTMSELTLIPDGNKHRNYYIVDQLKVFTFCKNGIPQYQQVL
jgi:hypothetical protein